MTCMNWFEREKTEWWKGVTDMAQSKDMKKEKSKKAEKPLTNPGDIKGKIEIPDTRARRDGPGGN